MVEGLWSVEFISTEGGRGAGVVILETQRIFGGDSQYFYLGKYEVKYQKLEAEIEVTHYSGEPNSIFGRENNFWVKITGEFKGDVMMGQGHRVNNPQMELGVKLTKRADLP